MCFLCKSLKGVCYVTGYGHNHKIPYIRYGDSARASLWFRIDTLHTNILYTAPNTALVHKQLPWVWKATMCAWEANILLSYLPIDEKSIVSCSVKDSKHNSLAFTGSFANCLILFGVNVVCFIHSPFKEKTTTTTKRIAALLFWIEQIKYFNVIHIIQSIGQTTN